VKFIKDAQESDRLSGDEVEVETVAENVQHSTQNNHTSTSQ